MWRRRANYDPMKAAAEGKRKQEAKKVAQASKYNERCEMLLLNFFLSFLSKFHIFELLICNKNVCVGGRGGVHKVDGNRN